MNILLVICYILGWLVLFGLGSLIASALLYRGRSQTVHLTVALAYGSSTAIVVVSVLFWISHLRIPSLALSYWLTVLLVVLVGSVCRRQVTNLFQAVRKEVTPEIKKKWLLDLFVATIFVTAFALLERYLPEYDGYVHERMSDILIQNGQVTIFSATYRPGFLYLFSSAKLVWPSASLFFTKFLFPILVTFLTIQNLRLWLKPDAKVSRWLVWTGAFSAPLFISQAIYFRAQSIVALLFPLAAYTFFASKDRTHKFLMLALTIVGILCFHIFFAFILIFTVPFLVSEVRRAWGWNTREKALGAALTLAALIALIPHLSGISKTISVYVKFDHLSLIPKSLAALTGSELGNPIALAKYYTHQILFFAVVMMVILLMGRLGGKVSEATKQTSRGLWASIGILFVGAEVLPRFGLQYDPQRIWLFINLLLICLLLWTVATMPSAVWQKRAAIFLALTTILSVGIVAYFVRTRLKTFNQDDRDAISYINSVSPQALIIGPNVKYPGIAIYKAKDVLYYISFPSLISYGDPVALDEQVKWLSYTTPESRRQKVANLQSANAAISAKVQAEKPVPDSLLTSYEQILTSHSNTPQPTFIYVCNNIAYCSDPGFSYEQQRQQLGTYPFLQKVYENDTVTVYRYLPTPGDPTPPKNYTYMEKVLLGSTDLTEFGSR